MSERFVYFIKSQNRLIIISNRIQNNDYAELLCVNNASDDVLMSYCKVYCLAFIDGATTGKKPINSKEEFS